MNASIVLGVAVVVALLLVWLFVIRPKVGVTPTGGITTPDHPATQPAPPIIVTPPPTPALAGPPAPGAPELPPLVPPVIVPNVSTGTSASANVPSTVAAVKRIRVLKATPADATQPDGEDVNWKSFAIGEIYAWSNGAQLVRSDFSDAQYVNTPNISDFPAWNAVDGKLTTFTHTAGLGDIHVLELTLATPRDIQKVEVFNRQDCCQGRLNGARLQLLDEAGNLIFDVPLSAERDQTFTR